jgi:hypothetical protein
MVTFAGSGHALAIEDSDAVNAAILSHIGREPGLGPQV